MMDILSGAKPLIVDVRQTGSSPLLLTSPIGRFGDDGAYLIVRSDDNMAVVRRAPLAEQFRVYVDDEGTLRADHAINVWSVPTLRFHYRLEHKPPTTVAPDR